MASFTGYTAARVQAIEDNCVVSGEVEVYDLVLERLNGVKHNAGNVRGPKGPPNPNVVPSGTIIMGGWGEDPPGYLILDGALVVGGAITYEDLADAYPSWVVGSNLQLPNATGAVPMAAAVPGIVSGANQHVLTTPNLASHTHTGPSHQHTGPYHDHTIDHNHGGAVSTGLSQTNYHAHTIPDHAHPRSSDTGGFGYVYRGPGVSAYDAVELGPGINLYFTEWPGTGHGGGGGLTSSDPGGTHNHYAYIPAHYGGSGYAGTGDTGAAGTGLTGSTGSATPVDHTPKNIGMKYAVKT